MSWAQFLCGCRAGAGASYLGTGAATGAGEPGSSRRDQAGRDPDGACRERSSRGSTGGCGNSCSCGASAEASASAATASSCAGGGLSAGGSWDNAAGFEERELTRDGGALAADCSSGKTSASVKSSTSSSGNALSEAGSGLGGGRRECSSRSEGAFFASSEMISRMDARISSMLGSGAWSVRFIASHLEQCATGRAP